MTDPADLPEDDTPQLVMPFVAVRSVGGPYADDAFVAGVEFQAIYDDLRSIRTLHSLPLVAARFEKHVSPALVPQLDLVAMECGFTLTATPWDEHPDEWVLAVFEFVGP